MIVSVNSIYFQLPKLIFPLDTYILFIAYVALRGISLLSSSNIGPATIPSQLGLLTGATSLCVTLRSH